MKERRGEHPLGDLLQLVFLGVFLAGWATDSFFLRATTGFSRLVPPPLRLAAAAVILAVGVGLAASGHVVLHRHRPAGVMTTGAFRCVRHPLYLASLLFYLGLGVSTASLLSLALAVLAFFLYDFLAGYEERLLVGKYGDEYAAYMRSTGKWLPRFGGSR